MDETWLKVSSFGLNFVNFTLNIHTQELNLRARDTYGMKSET